MYCDTKYKRLERETFEPPTALRSAQDDSPRLGITASQMSLILDGIELASARRRRRYAHRK